MKLKNYIDKIFIIVIVIILAALGYYTKFSNKDIDNEIIESLNEEYGESESELKETQNEELIQGKIFVHITGCVVNEAVYELENGSRVKDIVDLAGGLCDDADLLRVNLSQKLQDEMKIHIPKIGETDSENKFIDNNSELENIDQQSNKLININTADKTELITLSGIGEAKAQAIIDYRKDNMFKSIEEIKNVSGIGDKVFEKIKEYISVN